jgi:hypothetical protein
MKATIRYTIKNDVQTDHRQPIGPLLDRVLRDAGFKQSKSGPGEPWTNKTSLGLADALRAFWLIVSQKGDTKDKLITEFNLTMS